MTDRYRQAIDDINRLWGLHEYRDANAGIKARCLALAVDRRYVEHDGQELRVGISFGANPFPPDRLNDFDPPLPPLARFVFGMHLLRIAGNQLSLFDPWFAVSRAYDDVVPDEALEVAEAELRAIADEDYAWYAEEAAESDVMVSDRRFLEQFEIVQGELLEGKYSTTVPELPGLSDMFRHK